MWQCKTIKKTCFYCIFAMWGPRGGIRESFGIPGGSWGGALGPWGSPEGPQEPQDKPSRALRRPRSPGIVHSGNGVRMSGTSESFRPQIQTGGAPVHRCKRRRQVLSFARGPRIGQGTIGRALPGLVDVPIINPFGPGETQYLKRPTRVSFSRR